MFMLKIEVQMLNLVLHSLHWFYWIWCCPWCPAFRKKQMAMLQNSCAKVNCSSAFVTLILSNYKNQWIQICQRAYDDVQSSEWSRQKKLILNFFCYWTVFTHSLYCPLRVIKLKDIRTRVQYMGFEYELWTEVIKNWYIVMWESFTSDFIMTFCWNANYLQNLCCNRQWEDIAFSSWGYWKIFVFYEIALILIIERLFRSIDDIITKYCHCYCHCHCHQILSLLYYHAFII